MAVGAIELDRFIFKSSVGNGRQGTENNPKCNYRSKRSLHVSAPKSMPTAECESLIADAVLS